MVKNLVGQPDSSGGQLQAIDKALNGVGVQIGQPDSAQGGHDLVLYVAPICGYRGRFYPAQVIPLPDVQPLAHGHSLRCRIRALVDLHRRGLHLLSDFLLCLAGKRPLYLLAGAGIAASGDAGLPVRVLFAVAGDGLLPDRPAAFCIFSLCHSVDYLLYFLTPRHKKGIIWPCKCHSWSLWYLYV